MKVGDKVVLMWSQYGYMKGDVATIIDKYQMGYIVHVDGRDSTSAFDPYVYYGSNIVRPLCSFTTKIEQHYDI